MSMKRRLFLSLFGFIFFMVMSGLYFLEKIFNWDLLKFTNFNGTEEMPENEKTGFIVSETDSSKLKISTQIYEAKNGTPEQNMAKVLEMLGGIDTIIGKDDIVIIKPNGQQIRHNMTNTNTIKEFINQVSEIKGFNGEIIIAENHHYDPPNSAGWTTTFRNGDYNLNELVEYFQEKGLKNVTKYHWQDAGRIINSNPDQIRTSKIVAGPGEGDGYVWTDMEYEYQGRKTKMTYPIFTSSFSGITIDFKNGAWKNGNYTGQPVKFINISSLRNHSNAGVTATIKNYLGVVDLSCGFRGQEPSGYYNFHYIAVDWPAIGILENGMKSFITSNFAKKQKHIAKVANYIGPQNGALGGAVGYFMKTIRQADLNIIAAEYSGHEGRHKTPAHTKCVLASADPVALDYYAGKYVLYPLGGSRAKKNNPENREGTFRKYLSFCEAQGVGTMKKNKIKIQKFNFK